MDKQITHVKEHQCTFLIPITHQNSFSPTSNSIAPHKWKVPSADKINSINWFVQPLHHQNIDGCEISNSARGTIENSSYSPTSEEELVICEFFPTTLGHVISDVPQMQKDSVCCSKREYASAPLTLSHSCHTPSLDVNIQSENEVKYLYQEQSFNLHSARSYTEEVDDVEREFHIKEHSTPSNIGHRALDRLHICSETSTDVLCISPSTDGGSSSLNFSFLASGKDDPNTVSHSFSSNSKHKMLPEKMESSSASSITCLNESKWEASPMSPYHHFLVKLKLCILHQKEDYLLHHRKFLELENLRGARQRWYEINDQSFNDEAKRYAKELQTKYLPLIRHRRAEVFDSVFLQPSLTSSHAAMCNITFPQSDARSRNLSPSL